jgi:superfamily II DNA/RNA helicase
MSLSESFEAASREALLSNPTADGVESELIEATAPKAELAADEAAQAAAVPNPFAELGLAPELVQATVELGYTQPTTVQARAIPLAMGESVDGQPHQYNDLCVSSQTGSGKTAAFLLPVLNTLQNLQREAEQAERDAWARKVAEAAEKGLPTPKRPRRKNPVDPRNFKAAEPGALVLCPTRELAQQVAHDAIELVRHMRGVRIACVVGGMPYGKQVAQLQNANLVVATPGRLLDLQRGGQIKLEGVQFLVVDEADRMLDLGFSDDLAEVNQLTIERRQTMMFSATFERRIMALAERVMREPQKVEISSPQQKHVNIQQLLHWADNAQHKRALLNHWLRDTTIEQAIVFSSTQIECDQLAEELAQEGFSAVALHGALSQGMRNRRLMMLRQGRIQILVATDVAARGIDVPSISHVINIGLPLKSEDYVHRIGRTGRAGRDGTAVTIAEFRERRKIADIEFYTKQPFKATEIPGLEPKNKPLPPKGERGGRGMPGQGRGGDFGARGGKPAGGFKGGKQRGFGDSYGNNFSGFGDRRNDERRGDDRQQQARFEERRPARRDEGFQQPFQNRDERSFGQRNSFNDGRGQKQHGFDPRMTDQRGGRFEQQRPFENRGYENRGHDNRGFDNRRNDDRGFEQRQDSRGFDPRGGFESRGGYDQRGSDNGFAGKPRGPRPEGFARKVPVVKVGAPARKPAAPRGKR